MGNNKTRKLVKVYQDGGTWYVRLCPFQGKDSLSHGLALADEFANEDKAKAEAFADKAEEYVRTLIDLHLFKAVQDFNREVVFPLIREKRSIVWKKVRRRNT